MKALVHSFFHRPTYTVTHLVVDPTTKKAAVIDPVLDFDQKAGRTGTTTSEALLAEISRLGVTLAYILETHVHADHLTGAQFLKSKTGAPVVIGQEAARVQKTFKPIFGADDLVPNGQQFDRLVADGERLPLGDLEIEVLHTPGHTPACVTYKIGDAVFVGDTLFMPDYGTARCDFPGGDAAQLYRSIRRILALPAETRMFLCHDYGGPSRPEFVWETTVAAQRSGNIHIKDGVTEEAYVAMREARDATLEMPVLILPSVQVNMRAGHLPPADKDGHIYLKLPVNLL